MKGKKIARKPALGRVAHQWEPYDDPKLTPAQLYMSEKKRICTNCGAVQYEHKIYAWGRIASRSWQPPAGRCSKNQEKS
jgi:hypothetical protein